MQQQQTQEQTFPAFVHSLLERIQNLESSLPELQKDCAEIIETEREMLELAKYVLVPNRQVLQSMEQIAGDENNLDNDSVLAVQEMERHFSKSYHVFWENN